MQAIWNDTVIADSDSTIVIEGNHYFPADSTKSEYFEATDTKSVCPWKGLASYKSVTVDGKTCKDGAWYYPEPKPEAQEIQDYYAFWNGITVQ